MGLLAFRGANKMFELFRVVWRDTIGRGRDGKSRFRPFNWTCLGLLLALAVVIAVQSISNVPFYETYRGWYYILGALLFFATVSGPAYRVARDERDCGVLTTLFWGLLGMAVFLATFVAAFFAFVPASASASSFAGHIGYDRLLNVVPAVIAVWAAGLGWYAHHQIAMKGHRTTHAFNLIMQTRTNSEYIKNLSAFQLIYPAGKTVDKDTAEKYFKEGITGIPALRRLCEHESSTAAAREEAQNKILRLEAIHSGKYLLNYFEFMARGIKGGDLDENILYDTIGPTVIGVFNRTALLREQYRERQPLAMQFLKPVVEDWEKRKKQDAAAVS